MQFSTADLTYVTPVFIPVVFLACAVLLLLVGGSNFDIMYALWMFSLTYLSGRVVPQSLNRMRERVVVRNKVEGYTVEFMGTLRTLFSREFVGVLAGSGVQPDLPTAGDNIELSQYVAYVMRYRVVDRIFHVLSLILLLMDMARAWGYV